MSKNPFAKPLSQNNAEMVGQIISNFFLFLTALPVLGVIAKFADDDNRATPSLPAPSLPSISTTTRTPTSSTTHNAFPDTNVTDPKEGNRFLGGLTFPHGNTTHR